MASKDRGGEVMAAVTKGQRLEVKICDVIKDAMAGKGVTRAELARRLNMSRAAVTYALRGDNNFCVSTLSKIADALDSDWQYRTEERQAMSKPESVKSELEKRHGLSDMELVVQERRRLLDSERTESEPQCEHSLSDATDYTGPARQCPVHGVAPEHDAPTDSHCAHCDKDFVSVGDPGAALCPPCFMAGHRGFVCGKYCVITPASLAAAALWVRDYAANPQANPRYQRTVTHAVSQPAVNPQRHEPSCAKWSGAPGRRDDIACTCEPLEVTEAEHELLAEFVALFPNRYVSFDVQETVLRWLRPKLATRSVAPAEDYALAKEDHAYATGFRAGLILATQEEQSRVHWTTSGLEYDDHSEGYKERVAAVERQGVEALKVIRASKEAI